MVLDVEVLVELIDEVVVLVVEILVDLGEDVEVLVVEILVVLGEDVKVLVVVLLVARVVDGAARDLWIRDRGLVVTIPPVVCTLPCSPGTALLSAIAFWNSSSSAASWIFAAFALAF